MSRCQNCNLPEGKLKVVLNDRGICIYCEHFERNKKGVLNFAGRERVLTRKLQKIKGKYEYDAVVGLSGGKDSTYLLDLFVNEYNLNVIAVTVDTGFLSEVARQNIQKTIGIIQVDHVFLEAPRGIIDIYRYGFTHHGEMGIERDVCNLCDGMIRKEAVQFAMDNNIPLIADGLDPFQIIDAGLHRPDPDGNAL